METSPPIASSDTGTPANGRFFQRMAQRLNLTDDQKARIKTVLRAEKDTLTPLLGQLHAARMDLRAAIQANGANETTVRAASARVAAAEADLAVERLKLYGKLSPILTSEQRDKLKAFRARMDKFLDGALERMNERLAE